MSLLSIPSIGLFAIAAAAIVALVLVWRRRRPRWLLILVAVLCGAVVFTEGTPVPGIAWVTVWYLSPGQRAGLEDLSLAVTRPQRTEVVALANDGALRPGDYPGYLRLPDGYGWLAMDGEVWTESGGACGLVVFFHTVSGFSPDPYGGFEYVPAGCAVDNDPLGSGAGQARPLDAHWYWIDAS